MATNRQVARKTTAGKEPRRSAWAAAGAKAPRQLASKITGGTVPKKALASKTAKHAGQELPKRLHRYKPGKSLLTIY